MSDKSTIEWTDATWNPLVGCTKVSPGCDNCYAVNEVNRRHAAALSPKTSARMLEAFPARFDTVSIRPNRFLTQPLTPAWREPRRIFVNSLSDLFHADVPDAFIAQVFAVMAIAPQHTFQLLTKRHGRMRSLLNSTHFETAVDQAVHDLAHEHKLRGSYDWPLANVWLGVSVEDQHWADIRVPALLDTPAAVRWISAEPLLGPVDLRHWLSCERCLGRHIFGTCAHLDGAALRAQRYGNARGWPRPSVDWVVAGGESGTGARPMDPVWARSLRDQSTVAGVPFLFKQWGNWAPSDDQAREGDVWMPGSAVMRNVGKKRAGRHLDGRTHDHYPEART